MAWITVRQAMELTGKARSSLYRDMAKGRVSYRSEEDGGRSLETSELLRAYGALEQRETQQRDTSGLGDETASSVIVELVNEMKSLREEISGLRQEMQELRRLEHKPDVVAPTVSETWWQRWRRRGQ